MYKNYVKRWLDLILAILGLIMVSPIMLLASIAIKIDSRGPIIFKQKRLGQYGKEFNIYKFRTMCVGAENMGSKQYSFKSDPRITKVGRFLRATSIDELPQLFNIIKSEMSLIGFRPPLTYHPFRFEEYTDEQKIMFELKPGITGWAQIHGRKEVNWDNRIAMNVWYVKNVSLKVDIIIFFTTIWKVILNKDNENTPVWMGCYGIGIGRCMASVVEQNNDEKGIIWPLEIAPFKVAIVVVNTEDDAQMDAALYLYENLRKQGVSTILDDREERVGVKFNDMDLIGIPIRITVGNKINDQIVEIKQRKKDEFEEISLYDAISKVEDIMDGE